MIWGVVVRLCDPQELISRKERREVSVYMTTNGESRHQLSLAYVSPILSSCVCVCVVCDCVISASHDWFQLRSKL